MKKPPGPRGLRTLELFNRKAGVHRLDFFEKTAHKHGPISYFRILHQHTYLIDDADLVKEVLVLQQHKFGRDFGSTILRELLGDGLITREEPLHKERRRVLQPAFHRDQIASYVGIIARESERALSLWNGSSPIEMSVEMRRITLSIIGDSLFGPEFRESAAAISNVLSRVMQRVGRIVPLITILKPVTRSYRRFFPGGRSLFFESERQELDHILQPLIERRRSSFGRDVLSLLLALYSSGTDSLSDEDIRNEIVTFVLAGHETTATALTWACYLLSRSPEAQTRLAAEVDAALGDRPPVMEDLATLPFTTMVFNETLRLYPPVPIFGRRVLQPVTLAGYEIPRGATVLLSPYIVQRNPRYFESPNEFLPDRWLNAAEFPKFSVFPFGGGAKMCIGEPLARAEGVLILAEIFRRFQMLPLDDQPVGIDPRVTLLPDRPVLLVPRRREPTRVPPRDAPALAPFVESRAI